MVFTGGVSSRELKSEQAHLSWTMPRSLCVNLHGTTGRGKTCSWQTWEAGRRPWVGMGGTQISEKGARWSIQCTDGQRAGRQVPLPFSLRSKTPHFVPCPLMLILRCAITIFFLFCFSVWLLFLNKTGLLTSAMRVGC